MYEIDGQAIKRVMLEEVKLASSSTAPHLLSSFSVLKSVNDKLNETKNAEIEHAILTVWHDLYRTGHISWGVSIQSPDPPWFHLTEQGRKALETLSRDPSNPDGYLSHISKQGVLNPIALSYVKEALSTYNSNCHKASAVMIGAAAESMALELVDALIKKTSSLGRTPPKDLRDWRIKTVLDALKKDLDSQKSGMPHDLREAYEAIWPSFAWQIRTTRNDAGHPKSVDPITQEKVHASLLIFPELMKLTYQTLSWVSSSYA